MTWTVPREWMGETAWIIGGGESLRGFDAARLKGRGRVIGVNEAGLAADPGAADELPHAPWADVLYWADKQWINWNWRRLGEHTGRYRVARFAPVISEDNDAGARITAQYDIKVLPPTKVALSDRPTSLSGFCSGGAAINLAYLFGATRIVLLGFDMQGGNWHGRHMRGGDEKRYRSRFMPAIVAMAEPLRGAGIEVINAVTAPGASTLTCFPIRPLEDVLAGMPPRTDSPGGATPERETAEYQESIIGLEIITGLEVISPLAVMPMIRKMAARPNCTIVIRLAGPDIVTRRSPQWWRLRLQLAFSEVIMVSSDNTQVEFKCRNP
jgi:hypothetical protein